MQVDVGQVGQLLRVLRRVAGTHELLDPPSAHQLRFGVNLDFEFNRRHVLFLPLMYLLLRL